MTEAELNALDFDELDREIAIRSYGVKPEVLDALKWALPEFSADRNLTVGILGYWWAKPDRERLCFERHLQAHAAMWGSKGGLAEAVFVLTARDICRASIKACLECSPPEYIEDALADHPASDKTDGGDALEPTYTSG